MAQFKSIEATSQNIWKLQESLNSIDAATQDAETRIQALTAAIRLMVQQPDSGTLRLQISELCTAIDHAAFEAMNFVNSEAEQVGANFIDGKKRDFADRVHEASGNSAASSKRQH